MKKYELTDETKIFAGVTLYRIRALRDIPAHGVKAGDLGGWIEGGHNLSQDGDAWVSGNAKVSGDARVCEDAWVSGNTCVYGDAVISGDAWLYGYAVIGGGRF
jgi:carbonic anhydrase/acetyltransferase-like protein (isoleucine patch superfamily)